MTSPRTSMIRCACTGIIIAFAAIAPARAEWQVAAGVADEIDDDRAPVATVSYLTDHRFPIEIVAGYIGSRRIDDEGIDPTVFVGADLRWSGRWWFVGGGLAFVNNQSEVLSSSYQFMTLGGLRWSNWVLTLRHLSNADTRGRNRGETFLTLGYGW